MYRILIVEDETDAAGALRDALSLYGTRNGVKFATTWAKSPLEVDEDAEPFDLIFMDIEMPGQNGMDAARDLRLRDTATPLIFVTSLAAFAVEGYSVNALDFIVKPFTYESFSLRMDRAMRVIHQREQRMLSVRDKDGMRLFSTQDLVFAEMSGHDVVYHLASGETFSERGSMRQVEEELGGEPFLRISSGCIVNMSHVRGVADAALTMSTGDVVWASRANKRRCLEAIARHLGGGA